MLNNIRSYFIRYKHLQKPLERFVFPVVLLLYPLFGVTAGIDISDTTYSLANYEFMGSIDPMWMLSTYLSNVLGSIIMKLPGAGSLLGFNIYSSFIISAIALFAYYNLQLWMPGWMIFIGEFIAESICFCPRAILYNYLTYLLLTMGAIFLIKGIFAWDKPGRYLFAAGFCLGLNIMARFPNVVEAALILVLWFYGVITGSKFIEVVQKTLLCIAGYLCGFFLPLAVISIRYGVSAYPDMISNLFGATEGASEYSAGGMIASIVEAYMTTLGNMAIMVPCIMAGMIMFMMIPGKYVTVKKLLYIVGLLILARYYLAIGVFTRNYYYYDCMFQAAMMLIIIGIILSVVGSLGLLNGSRQEQTLSFMALMLILITPIGSNNYTFPILNNMFIIAPVELWLMRRLMQRLGDAHCHFAWQGMITMVIVVTVIQGALFHINFSFADGADGTPRTTVATNIPKAQHMVTTEYNNGTLSELSDVMSNNDLMGKKAILFGGIPGVSYLYDLEPAIDTVWPDLDTYSVQKFKKQIEELEASDELPMIIVGDSYMDYANIDEKNDILMDYIVNRDYNKIFENGRFTIYTR